MQHPRLDRDAPDRVYFVDAEAVRRRIHDWAYGPPLARPHERLRQALESPRANARYFVRADHVERCYTFQRSESHRLTVEDCARQVAAARFVGRGAAPPAVTRPD